MRRGICLTERLVMKDEGINDCDKGLNMYYDTIGK